MAHLAAEPPGGGVRPPGERAQASPARPQSRVLSGRLHNEYYLMGGHKRGLGRQPHQRRARQIMPAALCKSPRFSGGCGLDGVACASHGAPSCRMTGRLVPVRLRFAGLRPRAGTVGESLIRRCLPDSGPETRLPPPNLISALGKQQARKKRQETSQKETCFPNSASHERAGIDLAKRKAL
jgi:hypothetical protein